MASLRFFKVNAAVRNITIAKHGCFDVIPRRQKHLLSQNGLLVSETYSKSRKLLANLQNLHRYGVSYRLEHGSASASTNGIKANSSSPAPPAAPPPDSSVTKLNAEGTTINNNVQSSSTQAPPQVTSASNNQQITEAADSINELSLPPIPGIEELTQVVGEESFRSLGLGGFSFLGISQEALQFLHYTCGLPWWGAIVVFTVTVKICLFPLHIKGKRLMNDFSNKMAEYRRLKAKVDEAKLGGNFYEAAIALQEWNNYAVENNLHSSKRFLYPLISAPVFLSTFLGLRRMADNPGLTSFQTGGLFWFTNLSITDQYYLLPFLSGLTTHLIFRSSIQFSWTGNSAIVKGVLYGFPIIVFLFMTRFSSAILCFNVLSNSITLCQNLLLNWEPVRKYFNIPIMIPAEPPTRQMSKSGGMLDEIKKSFTDYQVLREIDDRKRLNACKFEENSSAPLRRTFKYNPNQAHLILKAKQKKVN